MFFKRVNATRANVYNYERQEDKKELDYIFCVIDAVSKRGFTGLRWCDDIRQANIITLQKHGYQVKRCACATYQINW